MVGSLNDTGTTPEGSDALILPAAGPAPPPMPFIERNPLRFAPGGATPRVVPAPTAALRPRPRRRTYSDLFDLAVVALMVACAAACVYRLFWAMQP